MELTRGWDASPEPGSTQPFGVYGRLTRARFYTAVGRVRAQEEEKKRKREIKNKPVHRRVQSPETGKKNKQTKKRNQHTGEATSLLTDAGTILDIGAVDLKWAM